MALPLTLPLKLSDIVSEFVAPVGTPFSEFVRGGTYVPDTSQNAGVPTVLPLAITDFFGASNTSPLVLTIPQDPNNDFVVVQVIDPGTPHTALAHNPLSATSDDPDEDYVIDVTLRCNFDHVDGDQVGPQLPGYSWAKQRLRIILGAYDTVDLRGVFLDFYFTSATSGYIRFGVADYNVGSGNAAGQDVIGNIYQDQPNSLYGNFVIPDGGNEVRVRMTRGESYTQNQGTGGGPLYTADFNLYLYQRNEWTVLWKNIPARYGGTTGTTGPTWNLGGDLAVANNRYNNNAECDLEFSVVAGAVGAFEI
jgi:hypothetical protein